MNIHTTSFVPSDQDYLNTTLKNLDLNTIEKWFKILRILHKKAPSNTYTIPPICLEPNVTYDRELWDGLLELLDQFKNPQKLSNFTTNLRQHIYPLLKDTDRAKLSEVMHALWQADIESYIEKVETKVLMILWKNALNDVVETYLSGRNGTILFVGLTILYLLWAATGYLE